VLRYAIITDYIAVYIDLFFGELVVSSFLDLIIIHVVVEHCLHLLLFAVVAYVLYVCSSQLSTFVVFVKFIAHTAAPAAIPQSPLRNARSSLQLSMVNGG